MAITRAQQAKQMLQDGGRIGFKKGRDTGSDYGQFDRAVTRSQNNPSITTPSDDGGNAFDYFSNVNISKDAPTTNIVTPLNINRGEINRIRNRRFLVEKPTFGMRVSDFIGGLPSVRFLKSLGEKGGTPFDAQGFGSGQGGGPQAMASAFIPAYIRAGFNTQEEYDEFLASQREDASVGDKIVDDKIERSLAFRADGGPIGGEYDFESARQMYGLGKLVKKVTRTVKKIAKSPIGKAALLYVGAGGLGNLAAGKGFFGGAMSNIFRPTTFLGNVPKIFSGEGIKNILVGRPESIISPGGEDIFRQAATKGIFGAGGQLNPFTTTAAFSLLGALTPEEELQAQELADSSTDFDLEKARNSILAAKREQYMMDVRARGFKAEGGSAEDKEPVAKKTMPLLDMGGKEMDLREEGGFVPIGRMEKADDVPARLSKNEFVFTADAVRNAGDGDVDKGAEVMYNMMKNLEAGGEVSEESQGLEGARKMFQTSQRLEEVL
jgi:hypothetical protein